MMMALFSAGHGSRYSPHESMEEVSLCGYSSALQPFTVPHKSTMSFFPRQLSECPVTVHSVYPQLSAHLCLPFTS